MRLPLQPARKRLTMQLPLATALLLLFVSCMWSDFANASSPLLLDIKRFKRTLSFGPNAATSYNLATALLSLGKNSAALPHLLDSLADPSFPGRHGTRHARARECL